jgi:hypothetical protein
VRDSTGPAPSWAASLAPPVELVTGALQGEEER